jgi:hypothetical protein
VRHPILLYKSFRLSSLAGAGRSDKYNPHCCKSYRVGGKQKGFRALGSTLENVF